MPFPPPSIMHGIFHTCPLNARGERVPLQHTLHRGRPEVELVSWWGRESGKRKVRFFHVTLPHQLGRRFTGLI